MKIKIGNFNFLSDGENAITSYADMRNKFNYFYLDGKEDELFVNSRNRFEMAEKEYTKNYTEFDFERELAKKYYIFNYYDMIKSEINRFAKEITYHKFKTKDYSRYELYNDIGFYDLIHNFETDFRFYSNSEEKLELDKNRIIIDGFCLNPYTHKIDNLEEMYRLGKFNKLIKNNLIQMEIEHGVAPSFIQTILKIEEFCKGKETINLLFKDSEKLIISARISSFLEIRKNNIELDLDYSTKREWERNNPGKEYPKLEDLQGIMYGKKVLEIDPTTLMNLTEQIAITPEDKINFKIDELKNKLYDDYLEHYRGNIKTYIPHAIEIAFNEIVRIDLRNAQIKEGNREGLIEEYPDWYTKEMEEFFNRKELLESLLSLSEGEDSRLQEIVKEIGDEELIEYVNEYLESQEESEEKDVE